MALHPRHEMLLLWMLAWTVPMVGYAQSLPACETPDVIRVVGEDHPLYRIEDARVDGARIVVLTQPSPAVHVFDDRTYAAWGEEGDGPGEVQNPRALTMAGEQIRVLDLRPGASRIITYTSDGTPVGTTSIRDPTLVSTFDQMVDTVLVEGSAFRSPERTLVRITPDGRERIRTFHGAEKVRITAEQGPMQSMRVDEPFASHPQWTLTARGQLAFWEPGRQAIDLFTLQGDPVGRIPLSSRPSIPVEPEDRAAWVERTFSPDASLFGVQDPYRGIRDKALNVVDFPETYPAVLEMKPDPTEGIWVLRAHKHTGQIWTLEQRNENNHTLCLPAGRELLDVGNRYLAVHAISNRGVETIEIYDKPGE